MSMSWNCGHLYPISAGLETRYHVLEELPVSAVYFNGLLSSHMSHTY